MDTNSYYNNTFDFRKTNLLILIAIITLLVVVMI